MGVAVLFKALFLKGFKTMRRYPVNMLAGIAVTYMIFLFIFYGYRAAAGPTGAKTAVLDAIVVGYLMWLYSITALASVTWEMTSEAQMGTLEQLFMNPHGFALLWFLQAVCDMVLSLMFVAPMLFAVMATTGRWLHLEPKALLSLLVVVPPAILSVYGCGLMLGGLALVAKQLQAVFQVVQFVFVAVIVAPVGRYPWLKLAPVALGADMVRRITADGVPIWHIPLGEILTLFGVAFVWMAGGVLLFRVAVSAARKRGLLAHY